MTRILFIIIPFVFGICLNLSSQTTPIGERGVFVDPRDGIKYRTVEIGNLVWFADDLAYKSGNEHQETLYKSRQVLRIKAKNPNRSDKSEQDSLIIKTRRATYQDSQKNSGDLVHSTVKVKENKKFKSKIKQETSLESEALAVQNGYMSISQASALNEDIYEDVVYDSVFITLYQWEDAMSSCPEGWRMPTDEDWKDLERSLGMRENRLDEIGFRGSNQAWHLKFGGYTKLEFYLLGTLDSNGESFARDVQGYWWSATFNMDGQVCYRAMVSYNNQIARMFDNMNKYYCVRCVKNISD